MLWGKREQGSGARLLVCVWFFRSVLWLWVWCGFLVWVVVGGRGLISGGFWCLGLCVGAVGSVGRFWFRMCLAVVRVCLVLGGLSVLLIVVVVDLCMCGCGCVVSGWYWRAVRLFICCGVAVVFMWVFLMVRVCVFFLCCCGVACFCSLLCWLVGWVLVALYLGLSYGGTGFCFFINLCWFVVLGCCGLWVRRLVFGCGVWLCWFVWWCSCDGYCFSLGFRLFGLVWCFWSWVVVVLVFCGVWLCLRGVWCVCCALFFWLCLVFRVVFGGVLIALW